MLFLDEYIYRCDKNYKNTVIKLLEIYKKNFIREIRFNKKELPDFFSLVLPKERIYWYFKYRYRKIKRLYTKRFRCKDVFRFW